MSLLSALQDLDYPCEYPFKLICEPQAVENVRASVIKSLGEDAIITRVHQRASRNGSYVALTVSVQASSARQIATVYQDLRDVPGIVTSL